MYVAFRYTFKDLGASVGPLVHRSNILNSIAGKCSHSKWWFMSLGKLLCNSTSFGMKKVFYQNLFKCNVQCKSSGWQNEKMALALKLTLLNSQSVTCRPFKTFLFASISKMSNKFPYAPSLPFVQHVFDRLNELFCCQGWQKLGIHRSQR